ncbi:U2 snRNP complex subunit [Saccharomycopsis crataegensis]|uniref:U2 snRNP complex subunit n=1 Tax=Saccharomycopsis crataegensis TaxID=43959 RepID=A0AAV5QMM8_9ASCO|nr:U2 snRNP complex subunit [Saccharomycopsis crataegensis]
MSRHQADLVLCLKQPGTTVGSLCEKCDGRCPVCDSYVRPTEQVRICDECAFGQDKHRCVICGGKGVSPAYYCFECVRTEKNRDGCPRITTLGSTRMDHYYEKRK